MNRIIVKLVGVTFYDAQKTIKGMRQLKSVKLEMIREPENPFDSNAIRVETEGHYLGYIPKWEAGILADKIDAGFKFDISVIRKNESQYHRTVGLTVEIIEVPYAFSGVDKDRERITEYGQGV